MNNKLLPLAVLAVLSGCATTNTSSTLIAGTGSGSSGLGNQTTVTEVSLPRPAENLSDSTATPIIDKSISVTAPNDDLKDFEPPSKAAVSNIPSRNRYSSKKPQNTNAPRPASSAGNPSSYVISGENYKVLPFSNGFVERGVASWYGADFHGEKTSNGETYNMYGMTAAHKRLPIPSYVRVTNLKNKRNVVLRVNDRGPFFADRVIDLSYAAAQKLDIHQPGTEMVQIEAIHTGNKESVYLQLGVFSNPNNARMLQKKVAENKMPQPMVKEVKIAGKTAYRVQLGPIFSPAKVKEFNSKLAKMGISETWYVTENKVN